MGEESRGGRTWGNKKKSGKEGIGTRWERVWGKQGDEVGRTQRRKTEFSPRNKIT